MSDYVPFSKRGKPLPDVFQCDTLPDKLRTQIKYILSDSLGKIYRDIPAVRSPRGGAVLQAAKSVSYSPDIFEELRSVLCREHGLRNLGAGGNAPADVDHFLSSNGDTMLVLDAVELAIRKIPECENRAKHQKDEFSYFGLSYIDAIDQLNHRFRENGVGYFYDRNAHQLLKVNDTVTHSQAIQPVLLLLSDPAYKIANDEYLEALEHYKHGRWGQAIDKAGSAYESVMKLLCAKHNWPHDPNHSAAKLLDSIRDATNLENKMYNALLAPANVRNLTGACHGGGVTPRNAEEHHCLLMLNLTAACMLYLVEEFG